MSLSKVIPVGNYGSITLGQGNGMATLSADVAIEAGGGDLKGFAKVKNSTSIEIHEDVLVDAGIAILEDRLKAVPMATAALEALKVELKALEAK